MENTIQGCYVALPTPFRAGRLDLEHFTAIIERICALGADGILVAGTTGEVPTLNDYEHRSLIHAAVECCSGRINVLAGVGTNCTRHSVELTHYATNAGVDGVMAITPYYNCPSRRGMLLHFGQIADATDLPMVLYNVPRRTGVDLEPQVAGELAARHDNIVAIKETSLDLERVRELVATSDLDVLCGEDRLIHEYCLAGAVGAISVVANLVPQHVSGIIHGACGSTDVPLSRELQSEIEGLNRGLALDVNPVPLKAAMAELELCLPELRLPLAPLETEARTELRQLIRNSPAVYALHSTPVELE